MWIPATEHDIRLAISEGSLSENASLDVKRETGSQNSERAETARDLASFAIDGGALLIGVAEDKTARSFALAPQLLEGASEKIEQIAANRVDPPLFVRASEIPTLDDPARGYLFVEIPPSAAAPHMVDGRYYARADKTKRRLTDAEVVRLHAVRTPIEDRLRSELNQWSVREVVPQLRRQRGHLNIVAEPLTATSTTAFRSTSRSLNNTPAHTLAVRADNAVPDVFGGFEPRLASAFRFVQRPHGGALTTLEAGVPRLSDSDFEYSTVDFELRDNGGFRIFMARLTDEVGENQTVIFDTAAAGYAWRAIALADQISAAIGYRGAWGFGLLGDRLSGVSSYDPSRRFFGGANPYASNDFEEFTIAHLTEIEDAPHRVVERLVGRLLHALGTYGRYAETLNPDPVAPSG